MITKERLQEIKGSIVHDRKYKAVIDWDAEGLVDELFDFIDELIAAYEQAQAEFADATVEKIALEHALAYIDAEYKEQLATSEAELDTSQLLRDRERYRKENIDLRAQLEETQYKLRSCKSLAKPERENLLERNTDLISERKKAQDEADSAVQSMVNLRKQLAEAEERDDAMDIIGVADKRTIADLRKEVKRLKATNGGE